MLMNTSAVGAGSSALDRIQGKTDNRPDVRIGIS